MEGKEKEKGVSVLESQTAEEALAWTEAHCTGRGAGKRRKRKRKKRRKRERWEEREREGKIK